MSALVRCPRCTDVAVLPAAEVIPIEGGMLFRCRACRRLVEDVVERDQPAGHPESPPPGPPLCIDDLLELHLLLATEQWRATLGSAEPGR